MPRPKIPVSNTENEHSAEDEPASEQGMGVRPANPMRAAAMLQRQGRLARVHLKNQRQLIHVRVDRVDGLVTNDKVVVQARVLPFYDADAPVKEKATGAMLQVVEQIGSTLMVKDPSRANETRTLSVTDVKTAEDEVTEPLVCAPQDTGPAEAGAISSGAIVWTPSSTLTFRNVRTHRTTCLHLSVIKAAGREELAWCLLHLFSAGASADRLQLKEGKNSAPLCKPLGDRMQPLDKQMMESALIEVQISTDSTAEIPLAREEPPELTSRSPNQTSARQASPPTSDRNADADVERRPTLLSQEVGEGIRKVMVSPDAWLHCSNNPPPRLAPVGRSDGFDIYIDGARGLPLNATISRVAATLYNRDFQKVGEGFFGDVQVDSNTMDPVYRLRHEVREASYDPTTTLLLVVYTVDKFSKKVVTVGYGVLNVFVDAASRHKAQPTNQNVKDFVVNTGGFQIALHKSPPMRTSTLTSNSLDGVSPVPCATLLLRLRPAAKSKDGLRTLSTADVDERDWVKQGLVQPMPNYRDGMYDSTRAIPTEQAAKLYNRRQTDGKDVILVQDALKFISDNTFEHLENLDEVSAFIHQSLDLPALEPDTPMDYSFVAEYNHEEGFWFAVDSASGLHRTVWSNATHTLAPPASFYSEPALTDRVHMTLSHDMTSDTKNPVWTDGLIQYRGEAHDKNACLIIELHTVEKKAVFGKEMEVVSLGWAILPVFKEEGAYVRSGEFKLPLYQGKPSKSFIDELQFENPDRALANAIASRRVQLYEYGSVTVRLVDYYRAGEFDSAGRTPPSEEFIDETIRKKYSNPKRSKPLDKLSVSELEMNKLIAASLNLKHYKL
eukprot:SAG31_NODE_3678_length_3996_cov_4.453682_1_plen_838_part_00